LVTTSLLSLVQIGQIRTILRNQVEASISESSNAVARQIENWLNGKLHLMDLASQAIDRQYSAQATQRIIDSPVLKDEFKLVFGALESDGKPIKNTASWNPKPDYDGRTRPWYATGKAGSQAVLTEPYKDSTTGEILISAVARISDPGQLLGVFGGDIRLTSVADEVRSLASRTQQSTQEIRLMIDQLQTGVRQAQVRMQQSRDTASKTAGDANAANATLERIREAIYRINDMNLQIAAAAEEQSATTEEINRNTTNIRDISLEVSGSAEKQVRQCSVMGDHVGQQDRLLSRFRI
jgi:hypothetical protein